ncbi:cellobiose dehydrogenase, partial [Auriculariales sp. MPI-PUGE-AT-0066]
MRLSVAAAALAGLVGLAAAQSVQLCDSTVGNLCFQSNTEPVHNISIRMVMPSSTTATEFIGVIQAPIAVKWVGWALGGQMIGNPLITAWPNNGSIVFNNLRATDYTQPLPWGSGPVITTIAAATSITSTTWKWVFRCQNCTNWGTGSFDANGTPVMAWAEGATAVTTPSSPNSTFSQHDDFNFWAMLTNAAHDANYDSYLNGGGGGTTTTTSTTTTSTTSTPTTAPTPYDYIVVGAGAGGIIVADRLSAAGKKVILLERGGPSFSITGGTDIPPWGNADDTRFDVPGLFEGMFGGNNIYWWCKDVNYFAGCLIGGGTAVNAALYYLPPEDDFSTTNGWPSGWQSITEAKGLLTARLPSTDTPSPDGVRYLQAPYTVGEQILKLLGYTNTTINSNTNFKDHVYGHSAYNFQNGKRAGPVVTYLQTALARSNFKFAQYTYVQSVVRNGSAITGVQTNNTLLGPNGFIPVTAKGRVILSAGTFGTPRLLFTSGIGPSDQIAIAQSNPTVGSQVPASSQWINLPVGSYVQDNPSINLVFQHPTVDSYDNWSQEILWTAPRAADTALYKSKNSGPFASASPVLNFWQTLGGASDNKTRYLQGTVRPGGYGIQGNVTYDPAKLFLMTVYLSYGITSRGRIGIDASMKGYAITRPWFTDPVDKVAMIQGLTSIINAAKQVSNLTLVTPDLSSTTLQTYVDNYTPDSMCSNHWIASCRIGTSSSTSVVDTNTKVWNTNNLFIIDASIFPGMPMANPHAAIMVSAEMAVKKVLALSGGP